MRGGRTGDCGARGAYNASVDDCFCIIVVAGFANA